MGKTKNNRMGLTTTTRVRKMKTMKNTNSKRRSKGYSLEGEHADYEYQEKEGRYSNLEGGSVSTSSLEEGDDENDNRWDFLYNMFSFLF